MQLSKNMSRSYWRAGAFKSWLVWFTTRRMKLRR